MTSMAGSEPVFERGRAMADAILYEGYLLYPYRKSSGKNRVRWQFGILAPRNWVERDGPVAEGIAGSVESWQQQTECLCEHTAPSVDDVSVHVRIRYLQLQSKGVERRGDDGEYVPVESLDADGVTHLSFDEAVPRESDVAIGLAELLAGERTFEVGVPGGEEVEDVGDGSARVVRRRWPVSATTTLRAQRLAALSPVYRLGVRTENTGSATRAGAPRTEALRQAMIATHALLAGQQLRFLSSIDPPEWAAQHVQQCHNIHTFPVLAGEDGAAMLSSPILLYDHPQVAPESPGDLHDGAEIDEILSLRTLTLTEDEQREARATDPRAAEILDRVQDMPQEVMARLHGAVRSMEPDPGRTMDEGR